jgi:AmmeMemoRadiSam system protein A
MGSKETQISWERLFEIAKYSILYYLKYGKEPIIKEKGEKRATFITLFINNNLRGCIGSILPFRDVYKDVSINAINAAFFDPRFNPLTEKELNRIKDLVEIEISLLTPMKKFEGNVKQWLDFLKDKKPGVFIKKGFYSATFLPDVWEEIPDEVLFMNHLALKAGLRPDDWVDSEKYYYFTERRKRKWEDINLINYKL